MNGLHAGVLAGFLLWMGSVLTGTAGLLIVSKRCYCRVQIVHKDAHFLVTDIPDLYLAGPGVTCAEGQVWCAVLCKKAVKDFYSGGTRASNDSSVAPIRGSAADTMCYRIANEIGFARSNSPFTGGIIILVGVSSCMDPRQAQFLGRLCCVPCGSNSSVYWADAKCCDLGSPGFHGTTRSPPASHTTTTLHAASYARAHCIPPMGNTASVTLDLTLTQFGNNPVVATGIAAGVLVNEDPTSIVLVNAGTTCTANALIPSANLGSTLLNGTANAYDTFTISATNLPSSYSLRPMSGSTVLLGRVLAVVQPTISDDSLHNSCCTVTTI